jgi:hypothetical protein
LVKYVKLERKIPSVFEYRENIPILSESLPVSTGSVALVPGLPYIIDDNSTRENFQENEHSNLRPMPRSIESDNCLGSNN